MAVTALIDYGSGNLASAAKALARAANGKSEIVTTADPEVVLEAERVVLPGVGAFADCMKGLSSVPGMVEALREKVLKEGAPFLGICVGMQLLATVGVEFGRHAGLGWIAGEVVKIAPSDPNLKIPHMGWNQLKVEQKHPLLDGIPASEREGAVVQLETDSEMLALESAKHKYERNLEFARNIARQDPKIVATVVKNWVTDER